MTREQVRHLLNEGFDIIKDGDPVVVSGDLWDYLDSLDESQDKVVVLEDALKWSDEELAGVEYKA